VSAPDEWTRPPGFPSGAGGLVSTVDDVLAFARLLLNRGVHEGTRLLSEESVELMTANHLTPDQIAGGGPLLSGHGWGYGMSVTVAPDDVRSPAESPRSTLSRPTNRLPAGAATCCTPDNSRSTEETEMRKAFMSTQKGIAAYPEDMTLSGNVELGDFGACRRR
jgi:CubicO group peptidase (beta-lactamase class C family)